MLPVSPEFLTAVRGSHGVAVTAVLCDPTGQIGTAPTGRALAVINGTVTLDGDADIRATLDLEVAEAFGDPDAADLTQELLPYGAEVFVTRGVEFGNGDVERVPLGYYRLNRVEQGDAPSGPVRLSGQDRMAGIIDARFPYPRQFLPADTYGAVVATVVGEVYPGATIDWDDASSATAIGRRIDTEDDRYGLLLDLAQSLGKIVYWDYRGHLVIRTPPDPTVPLFEVNAGANGVLVSITRDVSREGVYNAVVANGEAGDGTPPGYAMVVDGDVTSPTYFYGPFGQVPRFYGSPLLVSDAKALAAATTLLASARGLPYQVDFTAVPNPALEPHDAVRVTYPYDPVAVPHTRKETHVLARLDIPLGTGGALTSSTRKVTL